MVLPVEFAVSLVAGAADVEVEPSTPAWVWYVTEYFDGVPAKQRAFMVPDAPSVDYADLVEVDPATLDPVAEPEAAWWAIAAANVQGAEVSDGDLVLTRQDGSSFNAGTVRGPAGPPTTDASLLSSGTVPEGRLPARLADTALNATYAPVSGSANYAAKSVETSKLDIAAAQTTYVKFVDLAGNPISARHVTIKVDTSTWEIADIIAEA